MIPTLVLTDPCSFSKLYEVSTRNDEHSSVREQVNKVVRVLNRDESILLAVHDQGRRLHPAQSAWGPEWGAVTPFVLSRMASVSGGATLRANIGLIVNNARMAARIAVARTRRGTV